MVMFRKSKVEEGKGQGWLAMRLGGRGEEGGVGRGGEEGETEGGKGKIGEGLLVT